MKDVYKYLVFIVRAILFLIYLIGAVGILQPAERMETARLTPYILLVSAFFLLLFHKKWNVRFIVVIVIITVSGFFIEMLGIRTGYIFGSYTYGSILGAELWGVPLIIAVNWLILIYCCFYISQRIFQKRIVIIVSAALIMVFTDVLMEPVAVKLGLWIWSTPVPPLHNFAGWFLVSMLFATILNFARLRISNPVALYLYIYMVLFFAILNIML